jgi:hypothetical protein
MVIAHVVLEQEAKRSPTRARVEEAEFKGSGEPHIHHQLPGSFLCSPSSGGDSGDLAKRSAHPKLRSEHSHLGFVEEGPKSMRQGVRGIVAPMDFHKGESLMMGGTKAPVSLGLREEMDRNQNWVVEVYRGKGATEPSGEEEEDILELNLED